MRVIAGPAYGMRRERVIGSEAAIQSLDGRLIRTATPVPLDDGPGKTVHLWDRTGTQPVSPTDPSRSGPRSGKPSRESVMTVYRVTEIIGTSGTSWEEAAAEAIRTAAGTIRDLRVAEVVKQDIALDEAGAITYRTKLQLSFKYEPER